MIGFRLESSTGPAAADDDTDDNVVDKDDGGVQHTADDSIHGLQQKTRTPS